LLLEVDVGSYIQRTRNDRTPGGADDWIQEPNRPHGGEMPGPTVPHPIPYQGSKRQIAAAILSRFPEAASRLVEPFCGSAALSLSAVQAGRASSVWLNDANAPLMRLWREIIDRGESLANRYEALWNDQAGRERKFFDEVRAEFNRTHQPHHFLYLLVRSVKAVIRYNSRGEFNNTPDNRRRGTRPADMRRRIAAASQLLSGKCRLSHLDYAEVLARCNPDDIVYLDPPYQGVSGRRDPRYGARIDHQRFCLELDQLNRRGCRFLVSYDGRTGDKTFGDPLPPELNLARLEIQAGRSSQATLLGRSQLTYESLYLSPALSEGSARRLKPA
jgi:DNA adenine methylase